MKTQYNYANLKREFPREEVVNLLLEQKYTYRELQELYRYNERLWSKLAKEYNIPKQTQNIARNANKYHKVNIDDEKLIDLYMNKEYSLRYIAMIFQCNIDTVRNHLIKNNIKIRKFNDKCYYRNRNTRTAKNYHIDTNGYNNKAGEREHRTIMENHLNRKLRTEEHVHHIDLDKTNNNIENLFLFTSGAEHLSYHGYIKSHRFVHPEFFVLNIYPKIQLYQSKEFLYEQYVILNQSIAQINRNIDNLISRNKLSKLLKTYQFFEKGKHIN